MNNITEIANRPQVLLWSLLPKPMCTAAFGNRRGSDARADWPDNADEPLQKSSLKPSVTVINVRIGWAN